jgi:hypothetical protein
MNMSTAPQREECLDFVMEDAVGLCRRDVFLLEMYKQCSAHLNRHVSAMWQCIAAALAVGATLRMDETGSPFDYAVTLAVLLCTWLIASNLDASAWFNRNITIIANIERQFLERTDAMLVHALFLRPHDPGKIITHFRIQIVMAVAVVVIVLIIHFSRRLASHVCLSVSNVEISSFLPYLAAGCSIFLLRFMYRRQTEAQRKLNEESPGRQYE